MRFVRKDGRVQHARPGTALFEVLSGDKDWKDSAPSRPAPAAAVPASDGLDDLTRDQLNQLAEEKGIDEPAKLANKPAVIEAIRGV